MACQRNGVISLSDVNLRSNESLFALIESRKSESLAVQSGFESLHERRMEWDDLNQLIQSLNDNGVRG